MFCFNTWLLVIALHCILARATSTLIFSHRSLVFWSPTAQRANGGFIVRAPCFTPRASPCLGVVTPWAQHNSINPRTPLFHHVWCTVTCLNTTVAQYTNRITLPALPCSNIPLLSCCSQHYNPSQHHSGTVHTQDNPTSY